MYYFQSFSNGYYIYAGVLTFENSFALSDTGTQVHKPSEQPEGGGGEGGGCGGFQVKDAVGVK
jgi:hypothetical protein